MSAATRRGAIAALCTMTVALPSVAALAGSHADAGGDAADGDALDLRRVDWDVGAAGVRLGVQLAGNLSANAPPEPTFVAVLFVGDAGASEPAEWYVVRTDAHEALVLAGHTDPPQEVAATVNASGADTVTATGAGGSGLTVAWPRVAPAAAACAFAVVHSIQRDIGGDRVVDAAPDAATDLAAAWSDGALCTSGPASGAGAAESPPLAAAFVTAVLAALAAAARRHRPPSRPRP
jgi:hypothetical protein